MTDQSSPAPSNRSIYFLMSARCLPYAEKAIESLIQRSREALRIVFITDEQEDKEKIEDVVAKLAVPVQHTWQVHAQAEADARAANLFAKYPHLSTFRFGHPCWRKLTDPLLFALPNEEMIILDPDLYFPNYFSFEKTLDEGLLLMWQKPHCMLPHETVVAAYRIPVKLAHHADIGVAQLRNRVDLEWLDWLIDRLGGRQIPRIMHVEPIIWSAMGMRVGGGYLDSRHWHCWSNAQWKRVLLRLRARGRWLLQFEQFNQMKCFHAGGVAKWWLREAADRGCFQSPREIVESVLPRPFEELTEAAYQANQRLKRLARYLGYNMLLKPKS